MLASEMWIQKELMEAIYCFDNITEYDPDVVFDKNAIFSAFCFMKPT